MEEKEKYTKHVARWMSFLGLSARKSILLYPESVWRSRPNFFKKIYKKVREGMFLIRGEHWGFRGEGQPLF